MSLNVDDECRNRFRQAVVDKSMKKGSHYIEFTAAEDTPPVISTAGWRPTASALSSPVRTQRVVVVR